MLEYLKQCDVQRYAKGDRMLRRISVQRRIEEKILKEAHRSRYTIHRDRTRCIGIEKDLTVEKHEERYHGLCGEMPSVSRTKAERKKPYGSLRPNARSIGNGRTLLWTLYRGAEDS
ncbi:hypothetical protein Nepgr_026737 [Nepenthes gracilis]|uniref:Uncharacterized protein n=1 Tax=Nepenthes gracilis TaxID=150966 RepID=A0AAD3T8X4_NEPGR|nr:hypothetical protein Nepgr_026737 [Nepenthes gracilis]